MQTVSATLRRGALTFQIRQPRGPLIGAAFWRVLSTSKRFADLRSRAGRVFLADFSCDHICDVLGGLLFAKTSSAKLRASFLPDYLTSVCIANSRASFQRALLTAHRHCLSCANFLGRIAVTFASGRQVRQWAMRIATDRRNQRDLVIVRESFAQAFMQFSLGNVKALRDHAANDRKAVSFIPSPRIPFMHIPTTVAPLADVEWLAGFAEQGINIIALFGHVGILYLRATILTCIVCIMNMNKVHARAVG